MIIRFTLSKFYQVLPEVYFQQVHRSFVVNLQHVDSLTSTSLMFGLSSLSISKNFKAELLKKLNFFETWFIRPAIKFLRPLDFFNICNLVIFGQQKVK